MRSKTKKIILTDQKCIVSILQDKTRLVVLWFNRDKKLKFLVEHYRYSFSIKRIGYTSD
jgi:ribosomal protein L30E